MHERLYSLTALLQSAKHIEARMWVERVQSKSGQWCGTAATARFVPSRIADLGNRLR